ncbi:uncharacterized protein LOC116843825 isoform X2 [Odontomachus brunneus]|uniref:uncharacterized protein LOC116843825 isoform X2 n=1 Tax=Odontomachus brunneus TaxID=486640 RepID=UPI0013F18CE8|nr:uncharacterized protein LOC116843825 isoform X2 [Odontomachus brunneus]
MAQVLAAALRFYLETERYVNTSTQYNAGNACDSFATCTDNPFLPDIERQLLTGHRVQGQREQSRLSPGNVLVTACVSMLLRPPD